MPQQPASGLNLGDIYYILFRRKWLILGFSLLGFVAAGVVHSLWKPKYTSVAEIYIGYILQDASVPSATGAEVRPMADQGAAILGTELKIVQSLDLAKEVAKTIGPAKILGDNLAGTNSWDVDAAAMLIKGNLMAEVSPSTHIISLAFSHQNREVIQPVLDLVITNYINKHYLIHQRGGEVFDPFLNSWADVRRMRVQSTADQLAQIETKAGIVDIKEEMKVFTAHEAEIKQENYLAMTDLADARAAAEQLRNMMLPDRGPATSTNDNAAVSTNASVPKAPLPTPDELDAYNIARQRLADLRTKEAKLEMTFNTNNLQVKTNLAEIEAAEARTKDLEKATPGLVGNAAALAIAAGSTTTAAAPGAHAGWDPAAAYEEELVKIARLSARIAGQTNELALIKDRGTNLVQLQATISELERNKDLDEEQLKVFEKAREEADMREQVGARVSNIAVSEQPTPPIRETRKLAKVVAALAVGGLAVGLGLAFLLEMFLDNSLKRPQEVMSKLALPFFLSVPYLNGNSRAYMVNGGKAVKLLPDSGDPAKAGGADGAAPAPTGGRAISLLDEKHILRPFYETLRDRLIAYFEAHNLTHKPKLVALTSCHEGAGVSTMATGLASVLSETGEGNVLLVNMNSEEGDAHRFYKGKLSLGLDDLFEKEKTDRENALVRENLYVVKESSNRDKLPAILPKRFSHLVSKMKASDYDYIIFDMPAVTQISVTPRLARFMDMVLLVVESEKTKHEAAQWAASLLSESKTNVGVVMNKSRSYVPRRLRQEI